MKKFVGIFIVMVLLIFCICIPATATNDGIIKADRISAKKGETITVPVSYVNNPGVYILRVTLSYDADVIEYIEFNRSASDYFNYTYKEKDNKLIFLMDGQSMINVTGDIELFSLEFKVKKDAKVGTSLISVSCENGMATALKKQGDTITTLSLTPATSTGAVTVLCNEHTFNDEMTDGNFKCSECGAIKKDDGEISVDVNAGLPEIDASTVSSTGSDLQPDQSNNLQSDGEDKNTDSDGIKLGHFIPIAAAVLVAVLIPLVLMANKGKKQKNSDKTPEE